MSKTAFTVGETGLLGARPHTLLGMGLARHSPAIIWRGKASTPTFPADGTGAAVLTVTATTSGTFANVVEGMTVVLENNSTSETVDQKYYTYARKAAIAGTLYIDSLGEGTATLSAVPSFNFTVYEQYLPQPSRIRYNAATWYMRFDLAYVAQNANFGPQAVMGPGVVVYKNGSVTTSFSGSGSLTFSPAATITAYLWTFPDASTSTSATPTWANSTAYPNGAYFSLKVTDSNGDTHTGHRLYFKFDSSNKPKLDFEIDNYVCQWGSGGTCTIKSSDPLWGYGTVYNALVNECFLFGDMAFYTTKQNIGGNFAGAENIWMRGYITADDYEFLVDGATYTYTLSTVDELLRNQYGFPLTMDDTAGGATSTWLTMNPVTLDNIALHYCLWRSTILMCTDVIFAGTTASTRAKKYMDIPGGTMWDQLKSIYSWLIGGSVSVDWQGAIYCEQDIFISGAAPVQMIEVTSGLYGLMKEGWTHPTTPFYINKVSKFSAYGVDYATPIGSRSPDDPAAHGAALEEISAGLAHTQTESNTFSGRRRLQLDNHYPPASIPTRGIIRIDPTPQSTVGFVKTLALGYALVVRSISIEFDFENGMAYATLGCEHLLTTPPAGVTILFT